MRYEGAFFARTPIPALQTPSVGFAASSLIEGAFFHSPQIPCHNPNPVGAAACFACATPIARFLTVPANPSPEPHIQSHTVRKTHPKHPDPAPYPGRSVISPTIPAQPPDPSARPLGELSPPATERANHHKSKLEPQSQPHKLPQSASPPAPAFCRRHNAL